SSPSRAFSAVAATALQPSTRFATADLVASVLHLDFWDDEQASTMYGDENIPDIATLITTIKSDPLVIENGTITILGGLLVAFVNSGNYDARYRVLLRHLATLLGVVWEDFEDIEDSLADTIIAEVFVETKHSKLAREKAQRNKKIKRFLLVGAAGGIGGVLIGKTFRVLKYFP
ncbi:hypothetical protein OSTOST_23344, partial [Ostertagia ostertagi]